MTDSEHDRRHFTRIDFDHWVEIQQGESRWRAMLLDLSLKGLLVNEPEAWEPDASRPFQISILLENNTAIEMNASLRHQEGGKVGFEINHIDIDSASFLRRFVELNLGDSNILERELGALGAHLQ